MARKKHPLYGCLSILSTTAGIGTPYALILKYAVPGWMVTGIAWVPLAFLIEPTVLACFGRLVCCQKNDDDFVMPYDPRIASEEPPKLTAAQRLKIHEGILTGLQATNQPEQVVRLPTGNELKMKQLELSNARHSKTDPIPILGEPSVIMLPNTPLQPQNPALSTAGQQPVSAERLPNSAIQFATIKEPAPSEPTVNPSIFAQTIRPHRGNPAALTQQQPLVAGKYHVGMRLPSESDIETCRLPPSYRHAPS